MNALKFCLLSLLIMFMTLTAAGQSSTFDKISKALEAGNARAVANYFDKNVELTLPGNEGVFSKAQSEQVIKDFFAKNQPSDFELMHKGGSADSAMYAIGSLTTGNGKFRTYVFLKKVDGKYLVQQLKITNDQ